MVSEHKKDNPALQQSRSLTSNRVTLKKTNRGRSHNPAAPRSAYRQARHGSPESSRRALRIFPDVLNQRHELSIGCDFRIGCKRQAGWIAGCQCRKICIGEPVRQARSQPVWDRVAEAITAANTAVLIIDPSILPACFAPAQHVIVCIIQQKQPYRQTCPTFLSQSLKVLATRSAASACAAILPQGSAQK